jgi:hypothetical protein
MLANIVGQQLNSLSIAEPYSSAFNSLQELMIMNNRLTGFKKNKYLVLGRESERMKGNRREFFPSPEQSRTPSCII